jgi:Zn-dependent peptidase ImmA (M78 family)
MIAYRHIAETAAKVMKRYDESNPYRLAKAMGILLEYAPMGDCEGACKGFFMMKSRMKCITINSDLQEELQRIILAHEIGHAVLHASTVMAAFNEFKLFCGTNQLECEANVFAAETLLDDDSVKQALRSWNRTFFEMAAELCVPPELLDFKCRTMKAKGIEVPDSPIYAQGDFLKY